MLVMHQLNHYPCMCHPTRIGRAVCRTCNIQYGALFSDLSPGEQSHLIRGIDEPINEFSYEKGAITRRQGCDDSAIQSIRSGLMKRVRALQDGRKQISRLMKTAVLFCVFECKFFYQASNL